jgi:hypothetical protein
MAVDEDPYMKELYTQMGPPPPMNIYEQAVQQYPVLKDFGYTQSPPDNTGRQLEFWGPGDMGWDWGGQHYDRPSTLPPDKPGLEVLSNKARPIDLLGDAVSHHLVKTDPTLKNYYDTFKGSITPKQQDILQQQYQYDVTNSNEQRPFADWLDATGHPAMFRGYAFQQWPDEFNQQVYTPEQRKMFDEMMGHLKGK